jgi:ribosomal protein S18 acetylase RimI-like enzyme
MEIKIRSITSQDTGFVAWTLLTASRSRRGIGFWDLLFPGAEEPRRRLVEQFIRNLPPTFCHHRWFLIAEMGGRPAAALAGLDPRAAGPDLIKETLAALVARESGSPGQIFAAARRLKPFLTCVPEIPTHHWCIESVATSARYRRCGCARALITASLNQGRRNGFNAAQLAVLLDNRSAIRLYESLGFTRLDEKRHPRFAAAIGAPGIARFVCGL